MTEPKPTYRGKRKKKDNTIPTIQGVTLTMEQATTRLAEQVYPYLMGLSYAYMAELIEIFVRGGMPEEKAKENAAAIAVKAVTRFTESQKRITSMAGGSDGNTTAG